MRIKYILVTDDLTLGIVYHCVKDEITIGGFLKHRNSIISILNYYFDLDIEDMEEKFPARNKVTYTGKLSEFSFNNGKALLEKQGMTLNLVDSLGRIMR